MMLSCVRGSHMPVHQTGLLLDITGNALVGNKAYMSLGGISSSIIAGQGPGPWCEVQVAHGFSPRLFHCFIC